MDFKYSTHFLKQNQLDSYATDVRDNGPMELNCFSHVNRLNTCDPEDAQP